MKTYLVGVREIHVQQVCVEADNPEDAKKRVADGEGDYLDNTLEYEEVCEPEKWTVEEEG